MDIVDRYVLLGKQSTGSEFEIYAREEVIAIVRLAGHEEDTGELLRDAFQKLYRA